MTVSIVTQTCVRPESAEAFARWQGETSTAIAVFPGFLEQRLVPPKPPLQVDWVIMQRFASLEDAQRWLVSPERQKRIEGAASMLVGRDDVHIVEDDKGGRKPAPVSAVISTRVLPGKETEYRAWERKIAMAQSKAAGLQGYRFEPPVPGLQDDFVAILRFDTEANLQAWLDSPERKKLVEEAAPLTEEFHTRMARTGFEQWFRDEDAGPPAIPAWKQNMMVLLCLYPVVVLFATFGEIGVLSKHFGWTRPETTFVGNVFSLTMLNWLVPWISLRFAWWLKPPAGKSALAVNLQGFAILAVAYAALVAILSYAIR